MPRLDCFGVLRKMRAEERTRFVPVVVLTSSNHPEDVLTACRLGTKAYVDKVFDKMPWREVIQTLARFWLRVNQTPY
jgi:two-component system response regulator